MIAPAVEDFVDDLQPIAAELGVETAWALVRHFGATRLYIPKKWHESLDLNVIGTAAARAVCERFGPERIEVPRVPFTMSAMQKFARDGRRAGLSNGRIARALGISHRTVARLASGAAILTGRRRLVNDVRQLDLMDRLAGHKSRS